MSSDEAVERAAEVLREGGLVALPTETVYGLAADAQNELAVRRIFAVKGRPQTHPLIVHLANAEALADWARWIPREATLLAAAFWPGPLSLVLPRSARASDAVTGGQDTVALRVPRHPIARAVLARLGGGAGLAAPSANRFGKVSPTTAEHVRRELGDEVDLVLDGGPCEVGVESTIVDLSTGAPRILRPGGVPAEALRKALGREVPVEAATDLRVPGALASHYAPRAGLVLVERAELGAEAMRQLMLGRKTAVLATTSDPVPNGVFKFEVPESPEELARALYATLRAIDEAGFDVAVAALPATAGLGLAVADRLQRAAHPPGS